MTLSMRAKKFATDAHAAINQVRKYTGQPYIVHPEEVVGIITNLASRPPTEEMLAAAWLHDVVEDTPHTIEEIKQLFGPKVAQYVEELTDVSRPEHGVRATRKAIDRAHTALASPEAKTIKLADLISNTVSIAEHDPGFALVYMAEKELLLGVLKQGDPELLSLARFIVGKYRNEQIAEGLAA